MRWGRLKVFAGVAMVVFVMTLALVVGNRLSTEALGVLAGTVCGVGAAIPTSDGPRPLPGLSIPKSKASGAGLERTQHPAP